MEEVQSRLLAGAINPGGGSRVSDNLGDFNAAITSKTAISTPGQIISELLPYLLSIGGLILLVMLIMGGFSILTAGMNVEQAEKGKKQITASITGFIILFAAYWIAQIIQIISGVNFL